MEKNILEIKDLSISFVQYYKGLNRKVINVVRNLSLDVKEKEVLAIFGASGSGKSLLVHAILDLLPINAIVKGDIKYKGEDLTSKRLEKLRGNEISFIPQTINSLNPLLKAGKQVKFGIKDKKNAQKIQDELFEKFGLKKEVNDLYPFELSGGMARKVLVSTAVVNDVELVIADEFTPGMDKIGLDETIEFFTSLPKRGASAIMITHDIDTALQLADRIAIFYNGSIIEVANKDAFEGMGEKLKHPYSRALWQALPENTFKVSSLKDLSSMGEYVVNEEDL